MKRIVVIGATGDVGYGIVAAAAGVKWQILAVGRSAKKLQQLHDQYPDINTVVADISSEAGTEKLWESAVDQLGDIDAVVVSVNAPIAEQPLLDRSADSLQQFLHSDIVSHFNAAKTFISKLNSNALFLGIGGGMADFLVPNMGHMSMSQAALRMMYRAIAKEAGDGAPQIRELMILSMVNGNSRRDIAAEDWLTDTEIGKHVRSIIEQPEQFPKTVLTLQNRAQVGVP